MRRLTTCTSCSCNAATGLQVSCFTSAALKSILSTQTTRYGAGRGGSLEVKGAMQQGAVVKHPMEECVLRCKSACCLIHLQNQQPLPAGSEETCAAGLLANCSVP